MNTQTCTLVKEYGPEERWTDGVFEDFDFDSALRAGHLFADEEDAATCARVRRLLRALSPAQWDEILHEPDVLGVPIVGFDWDTEIKPYLSAGEAFFSSFWPVGQDDGGAVGAWPVDMDAVVYHAQEKFGVSV